MEEQQTLGQELIGNYNAKDRSDVAEIKATAAMLIDIIDRDCPDGRRKSIAVTNIESAAMFAVKALFEG